MATATADLNLYAHLMRRAGFGARLDELEVLASRPYEDVVEDLLHPERFPDVEIDMIERFYSTGNAGYGPIWWSRMFNSRRQLEEKMTLFWHHIFATGQSKSAHNPSAQAQINMFRRLGMTDIRTLLLELSKDPAMIFWLDNNENLKDEPNENYGRELLELFSMGVGNYTEEDVKAAAYAFTGWTLETPIPGAGSRYGGYHSKFVYLEDEHDHSDKDFLGELGDWDGDDIVDIIVKQPAAARFISRHMYNYFVADEPPVSNWNETSPKDPAAINVLSEAYLSSDGDIRSMLRALFNSDFFKDARYMRVKTPDGARHCRRQADRRVPGDRNRDVPCHRRDRLDGTVADEPPYRRRLAFRRGLDRRRHAERAGQLRRRRIERRRQARHPAHHRPA